MTVKTTQGQDGKSLEIKITGSFLFALHREFRDAYASVDQLGCVFNVNLRETEYMDSSALGMLLLLKEHAAKCNGSVLITGVSPAIRRILEIASFDKLFSIQG